MIDRVETIRRLRRHPVITMDKQNVTKDAADLLDAFTWRDIFKDPPPCPGTYLCRLEGNIKSTLQYYGDDRYANNHAFFPFKVVEWMHIPD